MSPQSEWETLVRDAWNAMADAYDEANGTLGDYYRTQVMGPALLAACGNVKELEVLDVGCGQGYFSRLLAQAGSRVTGIDISEKLIAHATRRQLDVPLGIQYLVMDAAKLAESFRSNTFDLIASCIALQDMAEPLNALREMRHVLKNAGRAVILVEHPTNTTAYREWETDKSGRKIALRIDRYFDTGPREVRWKFKRQTGEKQSYPFPAWVHTLEEWSLMISSSGFTIGRLLEPRPTKEQVDRVPQLDDCSRIPYFLIFDLVPGKR